jgi:hypothetical protein
VPKVATVDEYVASLPDAVQPTLREVPVDLIERIGADLLRMRDSARD